MSANGLLQCGDSQATTTATAPSRPTQTVSIPMAARLGDRTSRSGTATESAKTIAPRTRPISGAHATNCESSSPNAAGIAEKNRLVPDRISSAAVSARSWRLRLRR